MKTLTDMCESLLDSGFDISEQDILLNGLKELFRFFLSQDQDKSLAELERVMTNYKCKKCSPMRITKMAKDNIVVLSKMEFGILTVHFMTYLGGKLYASQIRFDWCWGNHTQAKIGALDKNNLASLSNHRPSSMYKCWTIPQEYFDELFDEAKSLR